MRAIGAHPFSFFFSVQLFNNPDLAYCEISGTLIFFDIARDRYFSLPEPENSEALAYLDQNGTGRSRQPALWSEGRDIVLPLASSPAIATGSFRMADTARAIWIQRRMEKRVATQPFRSVLSDVANLLRACPEKRPGPRRDPSVTIRAFEYARLLRSAVDRCLPRSMALALCRASDGTQTNVVIGVKLAPFGAHCWVQQKTDVLNDSVEEVLRYRPILVI